VLLCVHVRLCACACSHAHTMPPLDMCFVLVCVCLRAHSRVCSLMFAWTAVQDGCLHVCEQGTDRSPNIRNISADSKITAEATSSTL